LWKYHRRVGNIGYIFHPVLATAAESKIAHTGPDVIGAREPWFIERRTEAADPYIAP
jgi:hypothetical protein